MRSTHDGHQGARRVPKAIAVLAAGLTMLTACAVAPPRPATIARGDYGYTREYIGWLIRDEMSRHGVQGLSIALIDDQRIVWAQGFGYADVAARIPAARETVYRVGSISKLFTVTAAMQLVEQGRVDIDRPLAGYLPGFSIRTRFADAGPITPRMLMTHHSGLPSDLIKGFWTDMPFTQVVEALRDEYAAFPPNTVFAYSNAGMTLLGHMVQSVSGRDFVQHMDDEVLRPLGMRHASFALRPDIAPRVAKGYKNGDEARWESIRDVPAGNLLAGVDDLSRFLSMVFADGRASGGQIVRPETLAEMLRAQNGDITLDLDLRIGLGWLLGGLGLDYAGRVAWHSGGTQVFHSQMIALPDHKLGVVVLANSASARRAVDKVAAETLKLALEAKSGIKPPTPARPPVADVQPSAEALQRYSGHYATELGLVTIDADAGRLRAQVADTRLSLVPHADGWFGLQYRLLGLIPISLGELDEILFRRENVAGREVLVALHEGQRLLAGEKIHSRPIADAWRQRLGRYDIVNPDDQGPRIEDVRLVYEHGLLLLESRAPDVSDETGRTALAPLSDSEAVVLGVGRGLGGTLRVVVVDGEERLRMSGLEARRSAPK